LGIVGECVAGSPILEGVLLFRLLQGFLVHKVEMVVFKEFGLNL